MIKSFKIFYFLLFGLAGFAFNANAANYTSNGTGNWNTPTSWTPAAVPTAADNVTILAGHVITLSANASCTNLTINAAATLTANSFILSVSGNFTKNGTFNQGTGTVTFNGSANSNISGVSAITFYQFTLNKVSSAFNITLTVPVTVTAFFDPIVGILRTDVTNILTMTNGAATTIGSANSYVNGPMINIVATAVPGTVKNFPLGKAGAWRPAVLTVAHTNATSVQYTGELIASSAAALGFTNPGSINKVSCMRYWQIDRQAVANLTNAKVQLYYDVDDYVSDASNLRVVKSTGNVSPWIDIAGTGSGVPTGSITSNTFTSFSKFALGNANAGTNTLCAPQPPNDDCAGAISLPVNVTCTGTTGTTFGTSQSIPALTCNALTGDANDDVWYKFIATDASHIVKVVATTPDANPVIDLRVGACTGANILCSDANTGSTELLNALGLTAGTTYYLRVYDFGPGSGINFDICVLNPPNDQCSDAINLTVDAACTNGTNVDFSTDPASDGVSAGCWASVPDNTAWYKFTTGAAGTYQISTDNGGGTNTQLKLFSDCAGTLASALFSNCNENGGIANVNAAIIRTNLLANTTYYVTVDVSSTFTGTFCISVNYIPPPGGLPLACSVNNYRDEKRVGAGNLVYGFNDGSYPTFGNFAAAYETTHILYRASDLTAAGMVAGQINSLAFDVNKIWDGSTNAGSQLYPEVKIDMGSTAALNMVNYTNPTVTFSTVFNPKPVTIKVGTNNFYFENSYNWDGTANIVIRICWRVNVGGSAGDMANYAFTNDNNPGYNCVFSGHTNFEEGQCAIPPFTSLQNRRPNILFGFCRPCLTTVNAGSDVFICNGNSATLSGTAASGTAPYNYSWAPGGGTTSVINVTPGTTTTYTLNITDYNACTATDQVIVNVDNIPIGGTAMGSATVCSGSNSGVLTLSGYTGTTFQWEKSINGGGTWSTIAGATTLPYNYSNLTVTTWFRVRVINSCGMAFSSSVAITVNPGGGPGTWTWTGAAGTNWFDCANWDQNSLPDAASDVVIPGGTLNQPLISGGVANVRTILINTDNGAVLNINSSAGGVLNVTQ